MCKRVKKFVKNAKLKKFLTKILKTERKNGNFGGFGMRFLCVLYYFYSFNKGNRIKYSNKIEKKKKF